ncbi:MAG: hypothetical protein ACNA7J_09750, partial [Wenzhouxiangella sp.]
MTDEPLDSARLAELVLGERMCRFTPRELDALLGWLAGSARHGADGLIRRLGTPDERPDLCDKVYRWLDAQMFEQAEFKPAAAYLDDGEPEGARRARYRRLMTAFHPDRCLDRAEWLTPRSQSILAAYSRFRRNNDGNNDGNEPDIAPFPPSADPQAAESGYPPGTGHIRHSARLSPVAMALRLRLRRRLGGISHLQAKLLGSLALVTMLPLLLMLLLADDPKHSSDDASTASTIMPAEVLLQETAIEPDVALEG